jgi:hypothetical protein
MNAKPRFFCSGGGLEVDFEKVSSRLPWRGLARFARGGF